MASEQSGTQIASEQTEPQMPVMIQSEASESGTKTYDRSAEQESGQASIFDNVEAIAYKQWEEEERNLKEKIESVIQEIQLLLLENKFRTEEWRRVLGQEDLLPVISHKKFLKEFGDCLYLKQIDDELYTYLSGQLDVISDYVNGQVTLTNSRNTASVKYAREKVEFAHKYWQSAREERRLQIGKWVKWTALIFIFVFSVWNLRREERRQEEQRQEQQEGWEETHEVLWENIEKFKTQEQQWMQELLEENPESVANIRQQVQQMLEQGTISQKSYDEFMERYGLDEIDSGENEEEEEDYDRNY